MWQERIANLEESVKILKVYFLRKSEIPSSSGPYNETCIRQYDDLIESRLETIRSIVFLLERRQ